MPVTTTPRDILLAAYAKSTKNKPGTIATESTELLQVVIRAQRGLYAFAARVNPTFFATYTDVTATSGAWARPQQAESIFRIERTNNTTGGTGTAGDEVVLVPFDDRKAESGLGAVYRIGQSFYPAGNTPDPTGGDLRFYYAKRPSDPADLNAALDALWTEQFNELLVLEVAIYLALKDGRGDEAAVLRADRDTWARLFIAFLEHSEANERRRFGHLRRFNTNTLLPIGSLLAGGSELKVPA
jgi:hypothetical protein